MKTKDPLHVRNGPITRSKMKALKEALNGLVVQVLMMRTLAKFNGIHDPKINLIQVC
jgi:hypothetical protein